jgi:hypothetical protein
MGRVAAKPTLAQLLRLSTASGAQHVYPRGCCSSQKLEKQTSYFIRRPRSAHDQRHARTTAAQQKSYLLLIVIDPWIA